MLRNISLALVLLYGVAGADPRLAPNGDYRFQTWSRFKDAGFTYCSDVLPLPDDGQDPGPASFRVSGSGRRSITWGHNGRASQVDDSSGGGLLASWPIGSTTDGYMTMSMRVIFLLYGSSSGASATAITVLTVTVKGETLNCVESSHMSNGIFIKN
jgi:hypothetical protein